MRWEPLLIATEIHASVRAALDRAGVQVRLAADAAALVSLVSNLRPALVVLDRTTDDAAVLAAVTALSAPEFRAVPVAIFSDIDPPEDMNDGVFILRPHDVGALLRLVDNAVPCFTVLQ